jgi:transketolase
MALANKIDNRDQRVYALLGDGEINEGLVWEALMSAAHYDLSNLTVILDYNGLQIDGANDDVMGIKPVDKKFAAFGWNVIEIDGHDMDAILSAFDTAKEVTDKPSVILANTVKGKGVSFMEGDYGWHGQAPSDEQLAQALIDLGGAC